MSLLSDCQLQAINDFEAAARELMDELSDSASIELETLEILMLDLNNAWGDLKAQFEEDKES